MLDSDMQQWKEAIQTDLYNDLTTRGKYHDILCLLFEQQITPKKAAEAIAMRSLGYEPRLPELKEP
jgi:hypothetical protein